MFHVKHSAIAFMIMAEKRFLNRERFFLKQLIIGNSRIFWLEREIKKVYAHNMKCDIVRITAHRDNERGGVYREKDFHCWCAVCCLLGNRKFECKFI